MEDFINYEKKRLEELKVLAELFKKRINQYVDILPYFIEYAGIRLTIKDIIDYFMDDDDDTYIYDRESYAIVSSYKLNEQREIKFLGGCGTEFVPIVSSKIISFEDCQNRINEDLDYIYDNIDHYSSELHSDSHTLYKLWYDYGTDMGSGSQMYRVDCYDCELLYYSFPATRIDKYEDYERYLKLTNQQLAKDLDNIKLWRYKHDADSDFEEFGSTDESSGTDESANIF